MKSSFVPLVALSSAIGAWAHGEEAAKEMGPVAFMWPSDRTWGAAYDNTAPCGSSSGATNRTDFPMGESPLSTRIFTKPLMNVRPSSQWPTCTRHPRRIMERSDRDLSQKQYVKSPTS